MVQGMFLRTMWRLAVAAAVGSFASAAQASTLVDFADLGLGANTHISGTSFTSHGATFTNEYSSAYGTWRGWSVSTRSNTSTAGAGNQYSAVTGGGMNDGAYGVAFLGTDTFNPEPYQAHPGRIQLPPGADPIEVYITNTTYAAQSMRRGDQFAKKFGGRTGNDPDYFKLTIFGVDAGDDRVAAVHFTLADYTSTDNSRDYIVDELQRVNLSPLAGRGIVALEFALDSSDIGYYGMNTPAYFALDNLALRSPPPSVLGDATLDGRVGRLDLTTWLTNLGTTNGATWDQGDFDDDGRVTLYDLASLQSRYGFVPPAGSVAAVPEPTTLGLAAIVLVGVAAMARRRSR